MTSGKPYSILVLALASGLALSVFLDTAGCDKTGDDEPSPEWQAAQKKTSPRARVVESRASNRRSCAGTVRGTGFTSTMAISHA